jgi:hypothetical protein
MIEITSDKGSKFLIPRGKLLHATLKMEKDEEKEFLRLHVVVEDGRSPEHYYFRDKEAQRLYDEIKNQLYKEEEAPMALST